MVRTITVKGTGYVSAKVDYVVISFNLETNRENYSEACELASSNIELLSEALVKAGFDKDAIRTTDFNVRTEYNSVRDSNGNFNNVFNGYVVSHKLKMEFDFDVVRLSKALSAVSSSGVQPEINISFTVKDKTAVKEEVLRRAAKNAKQKAEILCSVSGVILGDLINIDYNWGEINVRSNTRSQFDRNCAVDSFDSIFNIKPENVEASDTATFVWEIK